MIGKSMNENRCKKLILAVLASACSGALHLSAQDNVFLISGSPVRGEISGSTLASIIVTTDKGKIDVPVQTIRNITFGKVQLEFSKAKDRFEAGRFDDGLVELSNISGNIDGKMLNQEIEYMKSWGAAKSALTSGSVTARDAGNTVSAFLKKFPDSHHFYALTELLGQLLVAVGRNDLAEAEFARLAESKLPEYELTGNFFLGQAQLLSDNGAGAEKSFTTVINASANDDASAKLKAVANCLKAKALLQQGKTDEARQIVEKIIQNENSDEKALFAQAYNVMGLVHMKSGDHLSAALAFLHTDLLFPNQTDAHAEALYYLTSLWQKLDKNDKSLESRTMLKSMYRNSIWATRIDQ